MYDSDALAALGWTAELGEAFETAAADGLVPGRVVAEHRAGYAVAGVAGEVLARARGRLHDGLGLPAVGDWVALRPEGPGRGMVEHVLPRRTCISRKTAGLEATEQVLVANVDVILILTGLDGDFSVRRLERYLAAAWDSGADPVVVLTKLDLCEDPLAPVAAESVAMGVPVVALSNVTGEGVPEVQALLRPGRTVVLLGSSGVGKSTLANRLAGDELMPTRAVRSDGRGRHTTRHRQLLALPGGALLVDTPGLRELQLWDGDLDSAFADVVGLAAECRFSDCAHETEPGCAVRAAIGGGTLDAERLDAYRKLQRELEALEARRNRRLQVERKRRWRQRARESRRARRFKG